MVRAEQTQGLAYSTLLHGLLLLFVVLGLPELFEPKRLSEPMAITVEILPITSVTNVKPSEQKPAPKEEKKPEEAKLEQPPRPAEEKPKEKPQPRTKAEEKKPEPAPAPEKPDKKAEKKKPEEKKPEKKKAPTEEDLMAVLKSVKETAATQPKPEQSEKEKQETASSESTSISQQYNPDLPLSLSEKDAIRSQIQKCWTVPAGAKNAHELIVVLQVEVERDGSVTKVQLAETSKRRASGDNFYRAAADSALRAVKKCSPLKNLPPEKYHNWHAMELTFDPKEMLF